MRTYEGVICCRMFSKSEGILAVVKICSPRPICIFNQLFYCISTYSITFFQAMVVYSDSGRNSKDFGLLSYFPYPNFFLLSSRNICRKYFQAN